MENDLTGKRTALYVRVSTEEQARHGLSLDEQEHELTDYAIEHGAVIVGVYRDEGTTARKSLKKRKELQRLLSDVKANEIDVILFVKLDRWFRNIADYYKTQEILDTYGVHWIATQEDYNTTSSNGRLILNLFLSIAENEADKTRERIAFVFEGKKRRKEWLGGHLPYGYTVDSNRHIVIDDKTADMIRDIFSHYLFTQSLKRTTIYTREKYGIHRATNTLRRALVNDCYIGTFYGIPNYAPPLIDLSVWNKVQYLISQNRRADTPRKAKIPYYFTGIIFCPSCNCRLGGKTYQIPRKSGRIDIYKYYICPKNNQSLLCDFRHSVRENDIERYLLQNIVEQARQYVISLEPPTTQCESIQRIEQIQESLRRLKKLYVRRLIDDTEFDKEFKSYNRQLQIAQGKQQRTRYKPSKAVQELISNGIPAIYSQLKAEGKRTFWHAIIKEIHITHFEKGKFGHKEFTVIFL